MQLIWFRNDLRSFDHAGLTHALATQEPVVAVFIATQVQWQRHDMAEVKRDLIFTRVADLSKQLAKLNIPLLIEAVDTYTDSVGLITKLCQKYGVKQVHMCVDYELNEQKRDEYCTRSLNPLGIKVASYHDSVIFPPGHVAKNDGALYKVFTPYKKQWLKQFKQAIPGCYPKPKAQTASFSQAELNTQLEQSQHEPQKIEDKLNQLKIPFSYPGVSSVKSWQAEFVGSEEAILNALRRFCKEVVEDYQRNRDFPLLDSTSKLSAYFAIGSLSPRQAINRLLAEQGDSLFEPDSGAGVWLSELIWREFYRHHVADDPRISQGFAVKKEYQTLRWRNNKADFAAWCEGRTGFPIVDAAMRQLNQTGWMHNRLRMITASFLVKDLQIDWRWGEQYFMRTLIDGDYAANNGGWQWSASTGHDAAPYFRIFNPTTQGERFDKKGGFIRRFCPELGEVPDKNIHQPQAYLKVFNANSSYPDAIVDHKSAREITLKMYKAE